MKKLLSIFIATVAIISLGICASGVENVGTISVTGITEPKKGGDTFTVGVNISDNPNIGAIIFDIDYDKERLEFLGAEDSGLKGWTVNTAAVWVSAKGSTQTGEILKLKFKVKESSPDGFAHISVANVDCATLDEKLVEYTVSSSGVSIGKSCAHSNKTKHTGKMSTCIEHGNNEYYTCNDCGAVLKADGKTVTTLESEKLPFIEHSLGTLVTEKPATCEAEGMKAHYNCKVCGTYFDENRNQIAYDDLVIMKTLHQIGEKWYGDENSHWHECATCGLRLNEEDHTLFQTEVTCTEGIYCTVCGKIIEPKKGHIDADGDKVCDVCGASWKELPVINAAGSSLSYKKGTDGNICIYVKNLGKTDLRFIKLNGSILSMNDYDVLTAEDGAKIIIGKEALERVKAGEAEIVISTVFCDLETKSHIEKADPKEEPAGNVISIPSDYSLKQDEKKSPAAIIIVAAAAVAVATVFVIRKKKNNQD